MGNCERLEEPEAPENRVVPPKNSSRRKKIPQKPSPVLSSGQFYDENAAQMNRSKLKKEFPIRMPERKNGPRQRKPKVGKKRRQEGNIGTPRKKRKKEKDAISDEE